MPFKQFVFLLGKIEDVIVYKNSKGKKMVNGLFVSTSGSKFPFILKLSKIENCIPVDDVWLAMNDRRSMSNNAKRLLQFEDLTLENRRRLQRIYDDDMAIEPYITDSTTEEELKIIVKDRTKNMKRGLTKEEILNKPVIKNLERFKYIVWH